MDLSAWEKAKNDVYDHVKQGGCRYVRALFGIKYDDVNYKKHKISRPVRMYYHYVLYEKDTIIDKVIEGEIENVVNREAIQELLASFK